MRLSLRGERKFAREREPLRVERRRGVRPPAGVRTGGVFQRRPDIRKDDFLPAEPDVSARGKPICPIAFQQRGKKRRQTVQRTVVSRFRRQTAPRREIAELKMPDLNAASVEAAMSMVAGTARSMGIVVVD